MSLCPSLTEDVGLPERPPVFFTHWVTCGIQLTFPCICLWSSPSPQCICCRGTHCDLKQSQSAEHLANLTHSSTVLFPLRMAGLMVDCGSHRRPASQEKECAACVASPGRDPDSQLQVWFVSGCLSRLQQSQVQNLCVELRDHLHMTFLHLLACSAFGQGVPPEYASSSSCAQPCAGAWQEGGDTNEHTQDSLQEDGRGPGTVTRGEILKRRDETRGARGSRGSGPRDRRFHHSHTPRQSQDCMPESYLDLQTLRPCLTPAGLE